MANPEYPTLFVVSVLYGHFRTWCLNNGIPPYAIMSQHKFTSRVRTDYKMDVKNRRIDDIFNGTKVVRAYSLPNYEIREGEEALE